MEKCVWIENGLVRYEDYGKIIDQLEDKIKECKLKDKEIERLNNELEQQNIEMGREIERLQDRIARANNFIDQVLLYRIPNKTKEVYEDIETLQNILNGSDKE